MKRRRLLIILAAVSALLLITIGLTTAYLTDVEVKDNIITIGSVKIELDEGGFDTSSTYDMVPGRRVDKAPKLINTGNKDEFVFIRLTVPRAQVTLLEETGTDKGKPKSSLSGVQEYFRVIAHDTPPLKDTVSNKLSGIAPGNNTLETTNKDIDIGYHSGMESINGWVLLEAASKSETAGGKTSYWDEYVFGYDRKLSPEEETVTLFDEVQLKSFIDGELTGETDIGLYCYGIQADNLKPAVAVDFSKDYFTMHDLNGIYTIVKNKAGIA